MCTHVFICTCHIDLRVFLHTYVVNHGPIREHKDIIKFFPSSQICVFWTQFESHGEYSFQVREKALISLSWVLLLLDYSYEKLKRIICSSSMSILITTKNDTSLELCIQYVPPPFIFLFFFYCLDIVIRFLFIIGLFCKCLISESVLWRDQTYINPLPSLTLQSARNLNVACRPKRSKARLLSS